MIETRGSLSIKEHKEQNSVETEIKFHPRFVSIATAIFYPNYSPDVDSSKSIENTRAELALITMQEAVRNGYQLSVVDGGSSQSFLGKLHELGIQAEGERERGMSASRRQAFDMADQKPDARVTVWTEPEKVSFVRHNIEAVTRPILNDEADIVVPHRRLDLFAQTYPDYQFESELEANAMYNGLLRGTGLLQPDQEDLDMFFGPKVYANKPEVSSLFRRKFAFNKPQEFGARKYANPERYSDAIFFPIVAALHKGLRVKSVEVPFEYPPTQLAIEKTDDPKTIKQMLEKRKAQSYGIRDELIHFIRYLNNDKKSALQEVFSAS